MHSQSALFTIWTPKFLPDLPLVEAEVASVLQKFPQRPLLDRDDQSNVCIENGVVVLSKGRAPTLVSFSTLPPFLFVWEKQVRSAAFNEESQEEGPHGHWRDFLQNLANEKNQGKWVVNHAILQTLLSSCGYMLRNFYPPENRRALDFCDRTTE